MAGQSMVLRRALLVGFALTQAGCAAWFSTVLKEGQIDRLRIEAVEAEPLVLILKGVPPIDSMKLPVLQTQKDGNLLKVSVSMKAGVGGPREIRPSWPEFVFPFAIDPDVVTVAYGARVLWERQPGPTPPPRDRAPETSGQHRLQLDQGKGQLAPQPGPLPPVSR